MRFPPSANAANARAISSGLTGSAPSPIAKYGLSFRVTPSLRAVAAMLRGWTMFVSCA